MSSEQVRLTAAAETANEKPDVKTLAGMLFRGGFPENYDGIIREMSDDEFELLWELFNQERRVNETRRS
jgi:hypothetical protein